MKTHSPVSAFEQLEQRRLLAGDISGVVSVSGTPAAGRSVYIDLDNDGQRDSNEPQTFTGVNGGYTFSGLTTGDYRLRVDVADNVATSNPASRLVDLDSANQTGINFNLTPVSEGVTDANDTLNTSINLGDVISKRTARNAALGTDVDIYRFTIAGGERVNFQLNGEGDHILRIFNSSGQQISTLPASGAYERISYVFSQPGTYYVGVSTSGNRAYNAVTGSGDTANTQNVPLGDYTLTLETDSSADFETADDSDFNQDDIADLVVRNNTTGANELWLRNSLNAYGKVTLASAAAGWRAVAAADFDGDGQSDILFRNANTGASSVWIMRNGVVHSFMGLAASTQPQWRLADATDFNGDGEADLLFHNTTTGQVLIQFMNGKAAAGYKTLGVVASNWKLGGTSEYDDNEGSLIWRNTTNGNVLRWSIKNLAISRFTTIDSRADQNWQITGVNEFVDDTADYDLLWRNTTTGENQIWYYKNNGQRTVVDLPSINGTTTDVIA